MNREQIILQIKRTAEANGNIPLGERLSFRETKLTRNALRRNGFANYGSAVQAAGYKRNQLHQAIGDDQLFTPLAALAREVSHFPTEGERAVARYKDPVFPGPSAFRRRAKSEPLRQALLNWCCGNELFADVRQLLELTQSKTKPAQNPRRSKIVNGYVYLMRYGSGKDFKIGCTENISRRQSQIDKMSPDDVRLIHSIETDDPRGIEKYWLQRFSERRVKTKEVFRLTPDDISAFKRRQYQ
jgi:hypothetical protein